jgi:hypothetical protein
MLTCRVRHNLHVSISHKGDYHGYIQGCYNCKHHRFSGAWLLHLGNDHGNRGIEVLIHVRRTITTSGETTMSTSRYSTREQRARVASVNIGMQSMRRLLESFIQDDRETAIRILNSVRPIDVIEYLMGRPMTKVEGTIYLQAIEDIPSKYQQIYQVAKVWQDVKQTCRKYLQGNGVDSKQDILKKFKAFINKCEQFKV